MLDATVAGASSDSYITLAVADALAEDDLGPEAERWRAPTTAEADRERALKRATREIDDFVRTGSRHTATQRLRFPSTADVLDGEPFIPADVQHATYYQALYVLSNAAVLDRANARHARNVRQGSEPDTSYTQGEDPMSAMSPRALQSLATYTKADRQGGSMVVATLTSGLGDPYAAEVLA